MFDKAGTITAANSSKLSDGAAACVLMSRDMADKLGLEPLAKILSEYKSGFCYFLLKNKEKSSVSRFYRKCCIPAYDV